LTKILLVFNILRMDTHQKALPPGNHGEEKTGATAARQGAAIIGFVAIAVIGMTIAVYAARFVPGAIGGIGSAAAYVSSLFVPPASDTPKVTHTATSTPVAATSTPVVTTPIVVTPATTTPTKTPVPSTPTPAYYGYADISTSIISTGYCTSRYQNSFVASSAIPSGATYGGATFMFTNVGTNIASGNWQFRVDTPTGSTNSYGVSLRPGQSAAGVVCFDRISGTNYVTVTADPYNAVYESAENNNTASRAISSNGSSSSNDDISCDLSVSDSRIDEGDSTTLRWDTDGDVDSARINQGIGSVDEDGGSKRIHPDEDTTYRMTVKDRHGNEETCSVTVRVD
jgi:hypothetical protein